MSPLPLLVQVFTKAVELIHGGVGLVQSITTVMRQFPGVAYREARSTVYEALGSIQAAQAQAALAPGSFLLSEQIPQGPSAGPGEYVVEYTIHWEDPESDTEENVFRRARFPSPPTPEMLEQDANEFLEQHMESYPNIGPGDFEIVPITEQRGLFT